MKNNNEKIRKTGIAILLIAALTMTMLLSSCGGDDQSDDEDGRIRVIATIFPQYDFVRQIAGERVELSMLLSPGAESHGFEPTARDIVTLSNADLLIYVGGHSDEWVERIVTSVNEDRETNLRTVALIDLVETVMTEHYHDHHHDSHGHSHYHHDSHHSHDDAHHEHSHHYDDYGHDHEHHHDSSHDHDDHSHHHHDHENHEDEHVWTCLRNAVTIVQALTDALAELDPDNAEFFRANAAAYIAELQELDQAFTEMISQAARTTVVFGDRFPFRYLTDTYGLTYHAAFTGCSPETQASPATIARLIETVRHENIPVIFQIELSDGGIARTIAVETGARILELHSAHNVSPADFSAGVTYLDLMRRNLEHLREALN